MLSEYIVVYVLVGVGISTATGRRPVKARYGFRGHDAQQKLGRGVIKKIAETSPTRSDLAAITMDSQEAKASTSSYKPVPTTAEVFWCEGAQ